MEELLASVETYNPDVDRDLIRRAFATAEERHRGQFRRSGEDFIHHPYGVARICAELHLDGQTIAAALLHDVIEDTDAELDELRAEFGAEIAQLVEGVTKLTRIQFSSREQAEAENYRKMIVAMAQDVRVILIKLADRLHNMRTIEYLGKQKQVQKAKETLEVYAPLAHRLGIHARSGSRAGARAARTPRPSPSPSAPASACRGTHRPHVVQPVGELDKMSRTSWAIANNHLAVVLRLGLLAARELDPGQLGDASTSWLRRRTPPQLIELARRCPR